MAAARVLHKLVNWLITAVLCSIRGTSRFAACPQVIRPHSQSLAIVQPWTCTQAAAATPQAAAVPQLV